MEKKLVYVIIFPGKKVYIGNTCIPIEERINFLKKDKDDKLYYLFKEFPNQQILFEYKYFSSFEGVRKEERNLIKKYYKDGYDVNNKNLLPYKYKK